ncbi:MAG: HDOD domain-containing protein [Candidatus Neomarinimicrobiota bacterium]|nr:MAG: HDOD domain-containing protein [Candidatus Neomarinimicrobiota bacterium]
MKFDFDIEKPLSHPKRDQFMEKIESMVGLPTLPIIASQLQQVLRDNNLSIGQMIPIISKDPSLAMKILKTANSAYYGLKFKVESLRQAIVIIGMQELTVLALVFSVAKTIDRDQFSPISWKRFWEHSAATAHIADQLNKKYRLGFPNSAFSIGLLHDIGKLILYLLDGDLYEEAIKLAQSSSYSSVDAENELFGLSHIEAGQLIMEKWNLPDTLQFGAACHHHPQIAPEEEYKRLAALIQTADLLSNAKGLNFGTSPLSTLPENVDGWQLLQVHYPELSATSIDVVLADLDDQMEEIKKTISLIET